MDFGVFEVQYKGHRKRQSFPFFFDPRSCFVVKYDCLGQPAGPIGGKITRAFSGSGPLGAASRARD